VHPELTAALERWDLHHTVVWLLPIAFLVYVRGWWHLHRQMPITYSVWRLASFAAGLTIVFLAIASPLDAIGALLLRAHMTQHMLLMMVAPPLVWAGQPVIPLLRGLPATVVKRAMGSLLSSSSLRSAGHALEHPVTCWTIFAVTFVVWHLPALYELGLRSDTWHAVQHACFFSAAMAFWWPVIGVWPSDAIWPRWLMIPYLVAADLLNTALSALLTFSGSVIYPHYLSVPSVTALSPLQDQSLAGVIMWVPGSIAFLLPAVILIVELFQPRARRRAYLPGH
jgi:cytochrome c oxidase assembly factor CtaG